MKHLFFILLLFNIALISSAIEQKEIVVPYTLEDRDRLIRVESEQKALRNEMNSLRNEMNSLRNEMNARFESIDKRFESVDKRFELMYDQIKDIKTFLYWGFGVLFTFMAALMGFVLWDRRTVLTPVQRKTEMVEKNNEKIIEALQTLAKNDTKLADILRSVGIL